MRGPSCRHLSIVRRGQGCGARLTSLFFDASYSREFEFGRLDITKYSESSSLILLRTIESEQSSCTFGYVALNTSSHSCGGELYWPPITALQGESHTKISWAQDSHPNAWRLLLVDESEVCREANLPLPWQAAGLACQKLY